MNKIFKKSLNIIRALLLVITFISLVVFCLYFFKPSIVTTIDKSIVFLYKYCNHKKYKLIVNKISKGKPGETLNEFENLLLDLNDIKKGDRLAKLKISTLSSLIDDKIIRNDLHSVERLYKELIAFDDRDVNVQIRYAQFLLNNLGQQDEAEKIFIKFYHLFPATFFVVDAYIDFLITTGNEFEAFYIYYDAIVTKKINNCLTNSHWNVYWDNGKGFSQKSLKYVILEPGIAPHQFIFKVVLPKSGSKLQRFRIDPPAESYFQISNIEIRFYDGERTKTYNYDNTNMLLHDIIDRGDGCLKTIGKVDPYFEFTLSELMAMQNGIIIYFTSYVQQKTSSKIEILLNNKTFYNKLSQKLTEAGRESELKFLTNSRK